MTMAIFVPNAEKQVVREGTALSPAVQFVHEFCVEDTSECTINLVERAVKEKWYLRGATAVLSTVINHARDIALRSGRKECRCGVEGCTARAFRSNNPSLSKLRAIDAASGYAAKDDWRTKHFKLYRMVCTVAAVMGISLPKLLLTNNEFPLLCRHEGTDAWARPSIPWETEDGAAQAATLQDVLLYALRIHILLDRTLRVNKGKGGGVYTLHGLEADVKALTCFHAELCSSFYTSKTPPIVLAQLHAGPVSKQTWIRGSAFVRKLTEEMISSSGRLKEIVADAVDEREVGEGYSIDQLRQWCLWCLKQPIDRSASTLATYFTMTMCDAQIMRSDCSRQVTWTDVRVSSINGFEFKKYLRCAYRRMKKASGADAASKPPRLRGSVLREDVAMCPVFATSLLLFLQWNNMYGHKQKCFEDFRKKVKGWSKDADTVAAVSEPMQLRGLNACWSDVSRDFLQKQCQKLHIFRRSVQNRGEAWLGPSKATPLCEAMGHYTSQGNGPKANKNRTEHYLEPSYEAMLMTAACSHASCVSWVETKQAHILREQIDVPDDIARSALPGLPQALEFPEDHVKSRHFVETARWLSVQLIRGLLDVLVRYRNDKSVEWPILQAVFSKLTSVHPDFAKWWNNEIDVHLKRVAAEQQNAPQYTTAVTLSACSADVVDAMHRKVMHVKDDTTALLAKVDESNARIQQTNERISALERTLASGYSITVQPLAAASPGSSSASPVHITVPTNSWQQSSDSPAPVQTWASPPVAAVSPKLPSFVPVDCGAAASSTSCDEPLHLKIAAIPITNTFEETWRQWKSFVEPRNEAFDCHVASLRKEDRHKFSITKNGWRRGATETETTAKNTAYNRFYNAVKFVKHVAERRALTSTTTLTEPDYEGTALCLDRALGCTGASHFNKLKRKAYNVDTWCSDLGGWERLVKMPVITTGQQQLLCFKSTVSDVRVG